MIKGNQDMSLRFPMAMYFFAFYNGNQQGKAAYALALVSNVDRVKLRLRTAANNGPIVHPQMI
jgi:hypothetical protein